MSRVFSLTANVTHAHLYSLYRAYSVLRNSLYATLSLTRPKRFGLYYSKTHLLTVWFQFELCTRQNRLLTRPLELSIYIICIILLSSFNIYGFIIGWKLQAQHYIVWGWEISYTTFSFMIATIPSIVSQLAFWDKSKSKCIEYNYMHACVKCLSVYV